MHDAVNVNVERDVDLCEAAWSGRDTSHLEPAKQVVVLGLRLLSLKHLYSRRNGTTGRKIADSEGASGQMLIFCHSVLDLVDII